MIHAGRVQEVRNYCLCDVVQTTGVFLRTELLRGELDLSQYRDAMTQLLQFIDADPRVEPVAAALDRKRLLLED